VSSGSASWFDFAQAVAASLPNPDIYTVNPIPSTDLIRRAKRPNYSVLDNTETSGPVIENWLDRWEIASAEILASIQ
jgi:dTDP-4-dehydrorhamnose reductase